MATKDLDEKSAILQRDGVTFAITPRIPCGLITDIGLLRRLADVAEKYQANGIIVSSDLRGQRDLSIRLAGQQGVSPVGVG